MRWTGPGLANKFGPETGDAHDRTLMAAKLGWVVESARSQGPLPPPWHTSESRRAVGEGAGAFAAVPPQRSTLSVAHPRPKGQMWLAVGMTARDWDPHVTEERESTSFPLHLHFARCTPAILAQAACSAACRAGCEDRSCCYSPRCALMPAHMSHGRMPNVECVSGASQFLEGLELSI